MSQVTKRRAPSRSRESFFCSPYRYVSRAGGDLPSLSQKARHIYASCLPPLITVWRARLPSRASAALVLRFSCSVACLLFRAAYTSHMQRHVFLRLNTYARTWCMMSFWYSFVRSLSILANIHDRNQVEQQPSNENLAKLQLRECSGNAFLRSSSTTRKYLIIWLEHYKQLHDSTKLLYRAMSWLRIEGRNGNSPVANQNRWSTLFQRWKLVRSRICRIPII